MPALKSKLSFIQKAKYIIFQQGLIYTFKNKPNKPNRPIDIKLHDIECIFATFPRDRWYNIIKNLIWQENIRDHYCIINGDKVDNYPISLDDFILAFNLDDLLKNYFNIEPNKSYTHSKFGGICYCSDYLPLDYKSKYHRDGHKIAISGNIPSCLGISDEGNFYDTSIISASCSDSSYHNYKEVDYTPIKGEALYYIKQITTGEITDKTKIDKFIYYLLNSNNKFNIGDVSYKDIFDSILF